MAMSARERKATGVSGLTATWPTHETLRPERHRTPVGADARRRIPRAPAGDRRPWPSAAVVGPLSTGSLSTDKISPTPLGTEFPRCYSAPCGPGLRVLPTTSLPQTLAAQVPSSVLRQQPAGKGVLELSAWWRFPRPRPPTSRASRARHAVDRVPPRFSDGVAPRATHGRRFSGSLSASRLTRAAPRRWSRGAGRDRTLPGTAHPDAVRRLRRSTSRPMNGNPPSRRTCCDGRVPGSVPTPSRTPAMNAPLSLSA